MTLLTTRYCYWCRRLSFFPPLFFPGIQVPERRERARADDRPEHVSSFCDASLRQSSSFVESLVFFRRLLFKAMRRVVVFTARIECPRYVSNISTHQKECRECLEYIDLVCIASFSSRIFFLFFFFLFFCIFLFCFVLFCYVVVVVQRRRQLLILIIVLCLPPFCVRL